MKPFITALCPTYRHPALLANSLALWLAQDYPLDRRELVILDDGQTFDAQFGDGWKLISAATRYPSLPAKYNALLGMMAPETDVVLVYEDDDIFLPRYCSTHAQALENAEFSKPSRILSDYTGELAEENGAGRFHSSMAFRRELIERIGGWPDTKRADFDQQLMRRLATESKGIGDPCQFAPPQYVYCWRTGAAHCQSTMRSPDDTDWYERGEKAYKPVPFVGTLRPKIDERTRRILEQLEVTL
jgi:hypothetical protein